jgi:hypothetical protein
MQSCEACPPAGVKLRAVRADRAAEMGNGATRTLERVAAALGGLCSAPVKSEAALSTSVRSLLLLAAVFRAAETFL